MENDIDILVGDRSSYGLAFDVDAREWENEHPDHDYSVIIEEGQIVTVTSDYDPTVILRMNRTGEMYLDPASSALFTVGTTVLEIGPETLHEKRISDLPKYDEEIDHQTPLKRAARNANVNLRNAIFLTVQS